MILNMNQRDEFYIEDVVTTGRREEEIGKIKVDDNVKIVLRLKSPVNNIDTERLWFRVLNIDGDSLKVELDNDPIYITSIREIDTLSVNRNNILEVLRQEEDKLASSI